MQLKPLENDINAIEVPEVVETQISEDMMKSSLMDLETYRESLLSELETSKKDLEAIKADSTSDFSAFKIKTATLTNLNKLLEEVDVAMMFKQAGTATPEIPKTEKSVEAPNWTFDVLPEEAPRVAPIEEIEDSAPIIEPLSSEKLNALNPEELKRRLLDLRTEVMNTTGVISQGDTSRLDAIKREIKTIEGKLDAAIEKPKENPQGSVSRKPLRSGFMSKLTSLFRRK